MISYSQINVLGPWRTSFMQNIPGVWAWSCRQSTGVCLVSSNPVKAPHKSLPSGSSCDEH